MIDLKKLQEKFDLLFEQETFETFQTWLDDKKLNEAINFLGEGELETKEKIVSHVAKDALCVELNFVFQNNESNSTTNISYSMAA